MKKTVFVINAFMKKAVHYRGHNHKVFVIKASGMLYSVIIVEHQYGNGSLALEAVACEDIGDGYLEPADSFGMITVNLGAQSKLCQFVKNYSENEGWAEALAKAIGGKDTGIKEKSGHVEVPFYDFSQMSIYTD